MKILAVVATTTLLLLNSLGAGTSASRPNTAVAVAGLTNHAKVQLRLAISVDGAGTIATDTSSSESVYNLSALSAMPSLQGAFLICTDESFIADPRWITIDEDRDGVRRGKPRRYDVRLTPPDDIVNDSQAAADIAAIHATESVMAMAMERDPERGRDHDPRADGPPPGTAERVIMRATAVVRQLERIPAEPELLEKIITPANNRLLRTIFNPDRLPRAVRPRPLIDPRELASKIITELRRSP